MQDASGRAAVQRLAVSKTEAAEMLSMSLDSFERYVMADVKMIRKGRLVLVPVAELGRWVERNAERLAA